MKKEIRFSGYTAVPSDYDCADGELAQSFNLLNETGSMQPLFPPKVKLALDPESEIIFIHKTSAFRHYIIRNGNNLYRESKLNPLGSFPGFRQANAIGNTLLILCDDGMHYLFWKDTLNSYLNLGSQIPFPEINFALGFNSAWHSFRVSFEVPEEVRAYVVDHWSPSESQSGDRRPVGPSPKYASADLSAIINRASAAVYAGLNSFIADAYDHTLFTEPFFIRYALRLFDGSHVMHSAPVLMIPNSSAPILPYSVVEDGSKGTFTADTKVIHAKCSLLFQILKANLSDWEDIVTHIDFFVSPPVYTFDQSGEVRPYHVSPSTDLDKFYHFGPTAVRSEATRSEESGNHRHPADPVIDPLYDFPKGNHEVFQPSSSGMVWNVGERERAEIEDAVVSVQSSLFYLVSSIEIGKVTAMEAFNLLDMEERSLRNIQTRTRLEDDYQSHHSIIPSLSHGYNARINLSGIDLRPFGGFQIPSMSQFCCFAESDESENSEELEEPASISSAQVFVRLRRDGNSWWVRDSITPYIVPASFSADYFPRWLFYPDSSAVEMIIAEYADDVLKGYWHLPLSTHPSLEGAYWFRGLGKEMPDFVSPDSIASLPDGFIGASFNGIVPLLNKIYTSEVNNPFFFPVTGINTIGTGRIMGICSAAKALSQGQFGQFPLYAFTDEGVWALEVSSSGGFTAKQPITRDVCRSAESITQIDSAVLFATDRGIMLISGSQTQCISDVLNAPDFLDFNTLPRLCDKFPEFAHPDCLFTDYIKNCRMAYDYVKQRIVLFNPDKRYSYVYSMKTKLWGIQACALSSAINSYPEALAMAKGEVGGEKKNLLVDLSSADADSVRCLLVSRPLKFDDPDLLKTVTTCIQRGMLKNAEIATVIYGTRDYASWHLIGSSSGLSLRSLFGTPYKAFRIVSISTLCRGKSITGCSFELTPRMTNRLR